MGIKQGNNLGGRWESSAQKQAHYRARRKILATQDTCAICGGFVDKTLKQYDPHSPEVDHIIPVSRGGSMTDMSNLQLVHRRCNQRKGAKLYEKNTSSSKQETDGKTWLDSDIGRRDSNIAPPEYWMSWGSGLSDEEIDDPWAIRKRLFVDKYGNQYKKEDYPELFKKGIFPYGEIMANGLKDDFEPEKYSEVLKKGAK